MTDGLCPQCGSDGPFSVRNRLCNPCRAARQRERYYSDRERILGVVKARMQRDFEHLRAEATEANRRYRERNREQVRQRSRERAARARQQPGYYLMARAREAVKRAIRRGALTRPPICEQCLKPGRIEAAHHDYTQQLAVRWLCVSCHRRWDAAEPKIRKETPDA